MNNQKSFVDQLNEKYHLQQQKEVKSKERRSKAIVKSNYKAFGVPIIGERLKSFRELRNFSEAIDFNFKLAK